MLFACLAEDVEGANRLALALARAGLRTEQTVGVPGRILPDTDAIVMSLGLREVPAAQAVERALTALLWLRSKGVRQLFLQHGNPVQVTDEGNVGQVIDALLAALGSDFTIVCTASPAEGVTVYRGHVFVDDRLLGASGKVDHVLSPPAASDLVGALRRQTRRKVGLVRFDTVARGPVAVSARFAALRAEGAGIAIVDALGEGDLASIGTACAGLALVTGGAAMAAALIANVRARGLPGSSSTRATLTQ